MADRTYLIKASEVTGAMEALATDVIENKVLKIPSSDVDKIETLLPSDEELWMSSDTAKVVEANGFQNEGILFPKKAGK